MAEQQLPPFGQAVAFAQRDLSALLARFLDEIGTSPGTWYAFQTIAARGPARSAIVDELAQAPGGDGVWASDQLDRLASEGLVEVADDERRTVRLTAEGEARFRSLRDNVAGLTAELMSPFDPAAIRTTVRTLQALTERAGTLHAG